MFNRDAKTISNLSNAYDYQKGTFHQSHHHFHFNLKWMAIVIILILVIGGGGIYFHHEANRPTTVKTVRHRRVRPRRHVTHKAKPVRHRPRIKRRSHHPRIVRQPVRRRNVTKLQHRTRTTRPVKSPSTNGNRVNRTSNPANQPTQQRSTNQTSNNRTTSRVQ